MNGFVKILENLADFEEICGGLACGQSPLSVMGVGDSVRAHIAFSVCKKLNKAPFFITSTEAQARVLAEDLKFFYGKDVLIFSSRDLLFYDIEASANDIKKKRLETLDKLVTSPGEIPVVTTISALLSATVPRSVYDDRVIELKIGDEIEMDALTALMTDFGYKRKDLVEGQGQFSIRGGIFDFFPFWSDMPYRIEFFDCIVDSIRKFYPETQRTVLDNDKKITARITPADEIVINRETLDSTLKSLNKKLKSAFYLNILAITSTTSLIT